MDYIGIALIIVTVVGCTHFVYKKAFRLGKEVGYELGIYEGRKQILEENIYRIDRVIEREKKVIATIH